MSLRRRTATAAERLAELDRTLTAHLDQPRDALDLDAEWPDLLNQLCAEATTAADAAEAIAQAGALVDRDPVLYPYAHRLADAVRDELQRRGVLPAAS